jgi:DNA-binding transcriptional regulator PaaX
MHMSQESDITHLGKIKNYLQLGTPKAKLATTLLCILVLASLPVLVLVAASMGNAVQIFRRHKISRRYSREQIKSSLDSLKRQKLIRYVTDKNGKTFVKITEKGKIKIRAFTIDLLEIKKQRNWDRKWRLVMYDLPVRFTKAREALRWKLKELGFFSISEISLGLPVSL